MVISAAAGLSKDIFGGDDYKQALADGYNDDAINSWLKTTNTPTGPEMTSKFSNYGSKAVEKPIADDYFDIDKFDKLLTRLEGSKGRQQRQKSTEGRRDIFAQGLASMMSNF